MYQRVYICVVDEYICLYVSIRQHTGAYANGYRFQNLLAGAASFFLPPGNLVFLAFGLNTCDIGLHGIHSDARHNLN